MHFLTDEILNQHTGVEKPFRRKKYENEKKSDFKQYASGRYEKIIYIC